jgi:hypothetical protein
MKAPILGLAVATAAFAGSSLYLWTQLEDERARSAQVIKASRELQARLGAFEKARGEFGQLRVASAGAAGADHFSSSTPGVAAPAALTSDTEATPGHPVWTLGGPNRSPVFQKMMRSRIRADLRRDYLDVGEKLGLSKEKAAQLVQLLADQQADNLLTGGDFQNPADAQRDSEQRLREQEAAINDLIGADKAQALKDYQQSIPPRMEAESLARQLEDNGAALSDAQKKQLGAVFIKERGRAPMPEYVEGNDRAEYGKSLEAWRNDSQERIAAEAGDFLSAEQMTAYNEIQQMQKDLNEQLATMSAANPSGVHRVVGQGNVVTFTSAAPAFIGATIVNDGVAPTAEKPDKK